MVNNDDPGTIVVGRAESLESTGSSVYNTGTMVNNNDPNAADPDATLAPQQNGGDGNGGGGEAEKPFFMRHIEANQSSAPTPKPAKAARKPEPSNSMSEQELETRLECLDDEMKAEIGELRKRYKSKRTLIEEAIA